MNSRKHLASIFAAFILPGGLLILSGTLLVRWFLQTGRGQRALTIAREKSPSWLRPVLQRAA